MARTAGNVQHELLALRVETKDMGSYTWHDIIRLDTQNTPAS